MEEKGRNNTALLTVIAIATLLVAVVGATFAYFSTTINNDTNNTVTVTAATAKAHDIITVTGDNAIELNITKAVMQQAAAPGLATSDQKQIVVSLTAGDGTATCNYDVVYHPTTAFTKSAANTSNAVEYALTGACTSSSATACSGKDFTDTDIKGSSDVTVAGGVSISDSYDSAAQPDNQSATTHTWDLTGSFYNLAVSQDDQLDNTFGGTISVVINSCTSSAN